MPNASSGCPVLEAYLNLPGQVQIERHVGHRTACCIDVGRDDRRSRLAVLAGRQHGVFTRDQAQSIGFTRSAVDHRVASGQWDAVDYGVYRVAGTPTSWHQRLLAACLGGPAVASHRAAARLWRLPGFDHAAPEVAALRHRRRHPDDVIWHESVRLADNDVTDIDGIPVTNMTRTLADLGAVCDVATLLVAFDDGVRRGLSSWWALNDRIERFGPVRRGSGTVRRVLARRDPREPAPESVLETDFEQITHDHGLPPQARQLVVQLSSGRSTRLDFAYRDALLAVEIDGVRYHAGPDQWRRDVARQNDLAALGWRVLRFTSDDLDRRGEHVVDLVRRALSALDLPGQVQIRNTEEP